MGDGEGGAFHANQPVAILALPMGDVVYQRTYASHRGNLYHPIGPEGKTVLPSETRLGAKAIEDNSE